MKLVRRLAYRTSMFVVTLALIVAIWELYKVIGPQDGGMFFGVRILIAPGCGDPLGSTQIPTHNVQHLTGGAMAGEQFAQHGR